MASKQFDITGQLIYIKSPKNFYLINNLNQKQLYFGNTLYRFKNTDLINFIKNNKLTAEYEEEFPLEVKCSNVNAAIKPVKARSVKYTVDNTKELYAYANIDQIEISNNVNLSKDAKYFSNKDLSVKTIDFLPITFRGEFASNSGKPFIDIEYSTLAGDKHAAAIGVAEGNLLKFSIPSITGIKWFTLEVKPISFPDLNTAEKVEVQSDALPKHPLEPAKFNNEWTILGSDTQSDNQTLSLATSKDGETWTSEPVKVDDDVSLWVGEAKQEQPRMLFRRAFKAASRTNLRPAAIKYADKFALLGAIKKSAPYHNLYYSEDLLNWKGVLQGENLVNNFKWTTAPTTSNYDLRSLSFANNEFVAVAQQNSIFGIVRSIDGVRWGAFTPFKSGEYPKAIEDGISFGNGFYYTKGPNFFTSKDLLNWTKHDVNETLLTVEAINGNFVAFTSSKVKIYNPTTDSWSDPIKPPTVAGAYNILFFNNQLIMLSDSLTGCNCQISQDGFTWNIVKLGSFNKTESYKSVDVAGGDIALHFDYKMKNVMTSKDGLNWTTAQPTKGLPDIYWIRDLLYGKDLFIAILMIEAPLIDGTYSFDQVIYTSRDGIEWEYDSSSDDMLAKLDSCEFGNAYISNCLYGNDRYLIHDGLLHSTSTSSSIVWSYPKSYTLDYVVDVLHCKEKLIAVTYSGKVYTSKDGQVWSDPCSCLQDKVKDIACNGDITAIVGAKGLSVSSDCVNWKLIPGIGDQANFVEYGSDRFLVGSKNGLFVSNTGALWEKVNWAYPQVTPSSLGYAKYYEDSFVLSSSMNTGKSYTSKDGIKWNEMTISNENYEDYWQVGYDDETSIWVNAAEGNTTVVKATTTYGENKE